jgi:hypothetical protein
MAVKVFIGSRTPKLASYIVALNLNVFFLRNINIMSLLTFCAPGCSNVILDLSAWIHLVGTFKICGIIIYYFSPSDAFFFEKWYFNQLDRSLLGSESFRAPQLCGSENFQVVDFLNCSKSVFFRFTDKTSGLLKKLFKTFSSALVQYKYNQLKDWVAFRTAKFSLGSLLKYFGCRIRVAHFSNWYF